MRPSNESLNTLTHHVCKRKEANSIKSQRRFPSHAVDCATSFWYTLQACFTSSVFFFLCEAMDLYVGLESLALHRPVRLLPPHSMLGAPERDRERVESVGWVATGEKHPDLE